MFADGPVDDLDFDDEEFKGIMYRRRETKKKTVRTSCDEDSCCNLIDFTMILPIFLSDLSFFM